MNLVRRREFIGLVAGAALPIAAHAQSKLPTIGFILGGAPTSQGRWAEAFAQGLHELGWIEGRTINIEYRWAEGRPDRYAEFAAELVRIKPAVIVCAGTEAGLAVKRETSDVPVVLAVAGDPIGTGLVASLARPGGNVTGLSNLTVDLAAKRIELVREILPALKTLGVLANANYAGTALELMEITAASRTLGLDLNSFEVREVGDIARAFAGLKGRAEVVYVVGDPFASANRHRISTFALAAHLPTICAHRDYIEVGGLISYGPNYPDLCRRSAGYVDKILRGARPADLPVQLPIQLDLVVNLITAKALGLTMPASLLARADEVIE